MLASAQPSRVHVAEDISSEHTALTGEETGEDRAHSEYRFPAPSLKEGCRKPVLGV